MMDLQGQSSSTRRALGRAKLQQELAAHRGTFFNSVVMSMARRMSPTMQADQPHGELLAAGISGVRYLERFGGYGRQRELGILQFNIMTAVDFLIAGNIEAAKDSIALTAVMVEQASMDHGRFDLAQVLTFQEDPPSSIFMTRATSQVSRSRAFARWITVSLAFLRELDTITTKRAELVGGSQPSSNPISAAVPKPKQPGFPKKKEADRRGGGGSVTGVELSEPELLNQKLDFVRRAARPPRWALRARNDFSWRLRRSFSVRWSGSPDPSAVFPLPVPFPASSMVVALDSVRSVWGF